MDLKKKHRPQRFEHLAQGLSDPIVQAITRTLEAGRHIQATCLIGTYGTGKTSIARLIGKRNACTNKERHGFEPCGQCEGCREIERNPGGAEFHGYIEYDAPVETSMLISNLRHELLWGLSKANSSRVIMLDEFHRVKDQEKFDKVIEDANDGVQFVLCVSDAEALNPAIASRCTKRLISIPTPQASIAHVQRIADAEGKTLAASEADMIVSTANCIPRHYVKLLGEVLNFCNGEASIPKDVVALACKHFVP